LPLVVVERFAELEAKVAEAKVTGVEACLEAVVEVWAEAKVLVVEIWAAAAGLGSAAAGLGSVAAEKEKLQQS
jgi:hypothetical protein